MPLELLNPSYYIKKRIPEEPESILDTVSKLFENTSQYINTYYPLGKTIRTQGALQINYLRVSYQEDCFYRPTVPES